MVETLTALFESWGIAADKAASQAEYLLDFPEMLDQIWNTVYAPAAATLLAYAIGLPLGILLVAGEAGGIRPLPGGLMRGLNWVVNLLRSVPFLILMALVMPLSTLWRTGPGCCGCRSRRCVRPARTKSRFHCPRP